MTDARAGQPVRIGVLGAAGIARDAVVLPARKLDGVQIVAIAARDPHRAQRFAHKHGIPRTHSSYDALLSDPTIDAVYVPLPAALHEEWATAALDAGKHVLVEKPFTSNAAAGERLALRASRADTIVMEAYHSGHHPLQQQLRTIIDSDVLGTISSATAVFCAPIPPSKNLRWNLALGGGGMLDVGYYPARLLRDLFGEVVRIDKARAHQREGIDRVLTASLIFDSNIRGDIVSSIWSRRLLEMSLRVVGSAATMKVSWPYHPQNGSRIRIDGPRVRLRARTDHRSSYWYQLAAFRDAIREGAPIGTDAFGAAAQMRAIDGIYVAAGMHPRP